KPCGNGMVLESLRYADEVKKAHGYFEDIDDIKPDKELLSLAEKLIEDKSAPFDADEYRDRYVDALKDLIAKKRKVGGKKILEDVDEGAEPGRNVIDLMAALKKSVESEGSGKKRKSRKSA